MTIANYVLVVVARSTITSTENMSEINDMSGDKEIIGYLLRKPETQFSMRWSYEKKVVCTYTGWAQR